jgi:hypothetical protein
LIKTTYKKNVTRSELTFNYIAFLVVKT